MRTARLCSYVQRMAMCRKCIASSFTEESFSLTFKTFINSEHKISTYRWSCRLKDFEHVLQVYFRSSLCVSLCLASALELLNSLPQIGHRIIDLPPLPLLPSDTTLLGDLLFPGIPALLDEDLAVLPAWYLLRPDFMDTGDLNVSDPARLTGESVSLVEVSPVHYY